MIHSHSCILTLYWNNSESLQSTILNLRDVDDAGALHYQASLTQAKVANNNAMVCNVLQHY